MRQIRTDMAMESAREAGDMPGVKVSGWENAGIHVTEVQLTDPDSAQKLGKPVGNYITLESEALRRRDPDARLAMSAMIGEEIARMAGEIGERGAMVVGLGNRMVTPDALGPLTVDKILVTRQIFQELTQYADERLRSVCAMAPGVMGVTGIETAEMLESIVRRIRPGCVVCVDALSARSARRIGAAVQICDTGIQPGSGVGNRRLALNRETLGVEVIAVGMPTVIYAATLARDAFEALSDPDAPQDEAALDAMERELLSEDVGEMIVTPREIDALVVDAAGIIASGLNRALHPGLSDAEIAAMMDGSAFRPN